MARIDGLPKRGSGLLVRFTYWISRRQLGKIVEPFAVTAHHRRLLLGWGVMEHMLKGSHTVDESLKELAGMKAAMMVGCEFCIDFGSMLSRETDVSEQQLRGLATYEGSKAFSPLEKLVLRYAAAMTATPAYVPHELFRSLQEHFSEAQLVELTAAIAFENYRARFNNAFGIGSQGFSEGSYCPRPESHAGDPEPSDTTQ